MTISHTDERARAREVLADVIELARRDIARTQTDFLGRMAQALCQYEGIFDEHPDGELPDEVREDAEDNIAALAGLALAQLAMLRCPDDPTAAFATEREEAAISRVGDGEAERLRTELAGIKASMAYRHSLIGRETARADAAEAALKLGERFLDKCNSAWAAGEPSHRVRAMLDAADAFRVALSVLPGDPQ